MFRANLLFVLCALISVSWSMEDLDLPSWFKLGAGTSAYQIEGAWNISDKSESNWDRFTHTRPDLIADGAGGSGDVACDSYHRWERDVQMCQEMGLDFYRFSLSWSRLLPTGFTNKISEDGRRYYTNLIDGLLQKGIEPMVTLQHFEIPQSLQDLGGWTNPLMADWFADYARVVFSLFAEKVKMWMTINEPIIICDYAYNTGDMAPAVKYPDLAGYLCLKNVILAHAKAWRIYDEEFKPKYHGKVSIGNNLFWFEADTPEDEEMTELVKEYGIGRFSHPIYSKEGGWPPSIEKIIDKKSREEGYSWSRLPAFTKEEIELAKGTFDYYALNHYSTFMVQRTKPGEEVGAWPMAGAPDLGARLFARPELVYGDNPLLTKYPQGLRDMIAWMRQKYGEMEIFITENGYSQSKPGLEDNDRVDFIRGFLKEILTIIKEDEVNVTGYSVWSLMDNFEWMSGYGPKFGLYEVDFSSPERERRPRKSARYFEHVLRTRSLHLPQFQ